MPESGYFATIAELIYKVRRIIQESDISDADIVDWFNDCITDNYDIIYNPQRVYLYKSSTTADHYAYGVGVPTLIVPMDALTVREIYPADPDIEFPYEIINGYVYVPRDGLDEDPGDSVLVVMNMMPFPYSTDNTSRRIEFPNGNVLVYYAAMTYFDSDDDAERQAMFYRRYAKARAQLKKFFGSKRPKPQRWAVDRW